MNSLGEMVMCRTHCVHVNTIYLSFWKVGFTAFIAHLLTLTPISQMLGNGYLKESTQAV